MLRSRLFSHRVLTRYLHNRPASLRRSISVGLLFFPDYGHDIGVRTLSLSTYVRIPINARLTGGKHEEICSGLILLTSFLIVVKRSFCISSTPVLRTRRVFTLLTNNSSMPPNRPAQDPNPNDSAQFRGVFARVSRVWQF